MSDARILEVIALPARPMPPAPAAGWASRVAPARSAMWDTSTTAQSAITGTTPMPERAVPAPSSVPTATSATMESTAPPALPGTLAHLVDHARSAITTLRPLPASSARTATTSAPTAWSVRTGSIVRCAPSVTRFLLARCARLNTRAVGVLSAIVDFSRRMGRATPARWSTLTVCTAPTHPSAKPAGPATPPPPAPHARWDTSPPPPLPSSALPAPRWVRSARSATLPPPVRHARWVTRELDVMFAMWDTLELDVWSATMVSSLRAAASAALAPRPSRTARSAPTGPTAPPAPQDTPAPPASSV